MEFGVFDHLDRDDQALGDYYRSRLQIIEAYDRLGFYAYHVAEHHATPLGMAPSPSVFLSAVAQRTRRLRFGPLVYALPLYHPLRMIEEICMLDQLSGGRLEIGFGRGSSPSELIYYGQDPDKSQKIYAEALELVIAGLTQRSLTFHGEFFHLRRRADGARAVAEAASADLVRRACARQRRAGGAQGLAGGQPRSAGRDLHRLRQLPGGLARGARRRALAAHGPRALHRGGATDAEALAVARRAYPRWHASFTHLRRKHNRINAHPRPPSFDELAAVGQGVAGTPDTVTAALARQIAATGSNYLVGQFVFGDLSLAEATRSIELFALGVMPRLAGGAPGGAPTSGVDRSSPPLVAARGPRKRFGFPPVGVAFAAPSPHIGDG